MTGQNHRRYRWRHGRIATLVLAASALLMPIAALADKDSDRDTADAADDSARKTLQALIDNENIGRQAARERARILCKRAEAAIEKGDIPKAAKLYQFALGQDPASKRAKLGAQKTKDLLALSDDAKRRAADKAADLEEKRRADAASKIMGQVDQAKQAEENARIDELLRKARNLYKEDQLELALQATEAILAINPDQSDAAYLRKDCMRRLNIKEEQQRRKRKDEAFNLLMDHAAKMAVPQNEILKRTGRQPSVIQPSRASAKRESQSIWERKIDRVLKDTMVKCSFDSTPLEDVVSYFRQAADINIAVDPRAGISKKPITLTTAKDIDLLCCIRNICRLYKLKWYTANEMVVISDKGQPQEPTLEMYDITDLVYEPKDFDARRQLMTRLTPDKVSDDSWSNKLEKGHMERAGATWTDFVRSSVAPGTWSAENDAGSGQYTIAFRNGKLVVNHTPQVHKQILELLDSFRKARNIHVLLQGRFIDMDKDYLEKVGVDWTGLGDGATASVAPASPVVTTVPDDPETPDVDESESEFLSVAAGMRADDDLGPGEVENALRGALLNDDESLGALDGRVGGTEGLPAGGLTLDVALLGVDQVQAIIQAVVKDHKGTLLSSPRLVCFNGQRANIVVADMVPLVMGTTEEGPLDIRMITDGMVFEVQPFVSSDQKYVTIEALPVVSRYLGYTEAEFTQTISQDMVGGVEENNLRLPRTAIRAVQTTVSVPDGGTIMLGGMADAREFAGYAGVPFVEKVPILRWFFSNYQESRQLHTLVMLLRADILILGEEEPMRGATRLP